MVLHSDPGELLTRAQPGPHVDRSDVRSSFSTSILVLDWRVPLGLGVANLVFWQN